MRVALISPLFESVPPRLYGGTERVVYNLCRGLIEADVEVTLFASGDSCVDGKLVPVVDEALRLRKAPVQDPVAYSYKMMALVAQRAHEFDVIHNHHDYYMLPLTEMTDVPVLTTTHNKLSYPDQPAAMNAFPNASYVSISNSQRAPMPHLRWLRTVYHGLDLDRFRYVEKPGKYLAFLGRISPEKRPDWAIEIAKKAGIPLKIAAKIEGPEGQAYFESAVKPHLDGKSIEYVGEISENEKSEFLGGALSLLFPIDWPEPFGLVVIEALACGTPVLARPCGSVPELLCNGITGYIDSDYRVLAGRVRDISQISRKACRQWAEQKFSLKRMTEEYIHVYRHLCDFASSRARAGQGNGVDYYRRHFLYPIQRVADGNT